MKDSGEKKVVIIIVITALGLFLFYKMVNFFKVDNCLDNGGSWNKEKCECEF